MGGGPAARVQNVDRGAQLRAPARGPESHAIIDGKRSTMTRLSAMHLVLLSTHAASGDEPSDLTVTFPGGSGGWESEAAARPATRACGGLSGFNCQDRLLRLEFLSTAAPGQGSIGRRCTT
eukprot:COSAG06_NODE_4337_length_4356_cov_3.832276_3_plen_121_part_00